MVFSGMFNYIVIKDLQLVVNVVIMLECLFLIKGELGIGKIMFVEELVESLGIELIQWYIKLIIKVQ